ncbi:MAG: tRNA adenosine(34) deaminase TadA [Desulfobacterales bacterium]
MTDTHENFMELALNEAKKAGQIGEVPVGAILVSENGEILSAAHNQTIKLADPTAHAEILTLRKAALEINNYRLLKTTLYVTVEPCIMCMGAIVHARISQVVFGAPDPKWGAAGSLYNFAADDRLNHRVAITAGVCAEDCRRLMQDFFRAKRDKIDANHRIA